MKHIRSIAVLALLMLALFAVPQMNALPTGVGSAADKGCYCHDKSASTIITVDGLPEVFESGSEYTFNVSVTNPTLVRATADNGNVAGFRILISGGGIIAHLEDAQGNSAKEMSGGLTHTEELNDFDTWTFVYTAPADDTAISTITIHGNAVNGGDGNANDGYATKIIDVAGPNASAKASSASALVILMTVIGLAVSLILVGVMWVFYTRNPETFSIGNFWSYIKPWLTTHDHKEIGLLYFLFGFFFFLVGGLLALLFRIQLALPENNFLTMDEYNSFFTLHGTTMIFLAAMPMIAGFMNYILPLQIGAQDLAFPRINALGFWLLVAAAPLIFTGVWSGESADITWVMYPPYSTLAGLGTAQGPNSGTIAFISGIALLGASSTLSGINFITTAFTMRAPGVTWMKMPLFTWSVLISVFMLYVSLPAFVIGVFFLLFDSTIGTVFFTSGGDPLLFQHLFWFFGHPEVYVVVVPAFGIVSEVLATSARRSIFGYKSMVYAMVGIGLVGFIVWGHHMLTSGMDPYWRSIFMLTTMGVAIPTGVKIFNWLATLWGGSLIFKTHTLWSLGFLITFTLGGLSGMFFPVAGLDTQFHDGYFVVAHFHYVFIGGTVFALFSAIYYWYPKAMGRKLNENLGMWHFLIAFSSFNGAFWPMHAVGIMGMPRRTHTYAADSGFAELNMAISIFAMIFGLSQLILVWNLIHSSKNGEKVGKDPWGGWSLEWATTSPPPTPSFAVIPTQLDANENSHRESGVLDKIGKKLWAIGEKDNEEVSQ
ncbi:MAG: cytochrome c oxidase subunit I [Candidatus Poseidoniales archaeon]